MLADGIGDRGAGITGYIQAGKRDFNKPSSAAGIDFLEAV